VSKGREMERPAWSDPTETPNETEQVDGKEGISRKASLTKMKSIRDGNEVKDRREIEPSGTVEMKPKSSSQRSRDGAQGEGRLPPGLQVSE
jgi:hypothetical protein